MVDLGWDGTLHGNIPGGTIKLTYIRLIDNTSRKVTP